MSSWSRHHAHLADGETADRRFGQQDIRWLGLGGSAGPAEPKCAAACATIVGDLDAMIVGSKCDNFEQGRLELDSLYGLCRQTVNNFCRTMRGRCHLCQRVC